jgi:arylsulfatase A-like enzyme
VPLLFFGAGVVPGSTGMPVSLTDVFPTLLEAADVAAVPASDGVSLWPAATGGDDPPFRTLFAEGLLYGADAAAALRWPFKLVLTRDGRAWLSELESDPYESRDARAEHPDVVEDLATTLTRRLEDARRANGDAAALDEDLRVQLRSLGYVR